MIDKNTMIEKLDEKHLMLDRNADPGSTWCFRSWQELFHSGKIQDGTQEAPMTVYLMPDVYWLHDPEDQKIFRGAEGDFLPYEQKISCNWLRLIGLSEHPEEVVIAANKGQSHGCIGNYTMLHFEGDGLYLENLTIGNYCNVDLNYPGDISKNKKKRCAAITQAQLGDVKGDRFYAKNCRFVSRLNLCPICGARRSLYENCHFESTDDALNGNAVYLGCDFDFYGECPISATDGTGSAFLDCRFRIRGHRDRNGADQYFMKGQGTIYVINCRFEDMRDESTDHSRPLWVQWTRYPQPETVCYVYGNDTPIGPAEHTVDLTGKPGLAAFLTEGEATKYNIRNLLCGTDGWDPLGEGKASGKELLPIQLVLNQSMLTLTEEHRSRNVCVTARYFSGEITEKLNLTFEMVGDEEAQLGISLLKQGHTLILSGENDGTGILQGILLARTDTGLMAMAEVAVTPTTRPAPGWIQHPHILWQSGKFVLHYELERKGAEDASLISWELEKDGERQRVSVSRPGVENLEYFPGNEAIGAAVYVQIIPKLNCSLPAETVELCACKEMNANMITNPCQIQTDFSNFPTERQPLIRSGWWTRDFYTPREPLTEWRKWEQKLPDMPWVYRMAGNGCEGAGLMPAIQGVMLFYTFQKEAGNMKTEILLDPAKTFGQGFGSAGQYMDVCVGFDPESMTGPAFRILRSPDISNGVEVFPVYYKNGLTTLPETRRYTAGFVTGCHIETEINNRSLKVHLWTEKELSTGILEYPSDITMETGAVPAGGSMGILHTGTCGGGGWQNTVMLHGIRAQLMD